MNDRYVSDIDLTEFSIGDAMFRKESTPVGFKLKNCEPTFMCRPLDAEATRDLALEGVDTRLHFRVKIDPLDATTVGAQIALIHEKGKYLEKEVNGQTIEVTEVGRNTLKAWAEGLLAHTGASSSQPSEEWMEETIEAHEKRLKIAARLVTGWTGLKAGDRELPGKTPEDIAQLANMPELLRAIIIECKKLTVRLEKNSLISSDGTSEAVPAGETTSTPADKSGASPT